MARFLKNFGLQSWKLKTGSAMAPILISYRVFTILYSVFSRTRPKDFQSSILRKVLLYDSLKIRHGTIRI